MAHLGGSKDAPTYVGTAGWSLPRPTQEHFATPGTHLARYASRLFATEINSSFHRSHRPSTYARWAASVPASFRFSVKIPKLATHEKKLVGVDAELERFLTEIAPLGAKLGCLLVQLPPSLALEEGAANAFFTLLRRQYAGDVVAEPRHATWFTPNGDALLACHRVGRVAADPAHGREAAFPGGWARVVYYRLHGSPRTYYSTYASSYLAALANRLHAAARVADAVWCIFDNTASGAATGNAVDLHRMLTCSDRP